MSTRYSAYPICRHTKTNGRRCQAPALATSAFCYHHQKMRATRMSAIPTGPGFSTHVLHPLRNARSIQQALAMIVSGLAADRLHPKQAGKMIYALQIAQSSLRKHQ